MSEALNNLLSLTDKSADTVNCTKALQLLRIIQSRMLHHASLCDIGGERGEEFSVYFEVTQKLQYETKTKGS